MKAVILCGGFGTRFSEETKLANNRENTKVTNKIGQNHCNFTTFFPVFHCFH